MFFMNIKAKVLKRARFFTLTQLLFYFYYVPTTILT